MIGLWGETRMVGEFHHRLSQIITDKVVSGCLKWFEMVSGKINVEHGFDG